MIKLTQRLVSCFVSQQLHQHRRHKMSRERNVKLKLIQFVFGTLQSLHLKKLSLAVDFVTNEATRPSTAAPHFDVSCRLSSTSEGTDSCLWRSVLGRGKLAALLAE